MDIKKQLLITHSKENAETIAAYIGNDADRFKELVDLFLEKEYRISQRSAMVLGKCTDAHPELIFPHLEKIILNLQNDITDAVKRNTIRTLQDVRIPDELLGLTTDILFRIMEDPGEAIAIKVFTMTVLSNVCERVPEFSRELKIIIENQMPYGSAGFKNRGQKILAKLEKLIIEHP